MEQTTPKHHHRKNKYAAPIGGIYLILVVIGLIAVIVASVKLTNKILDNSNEKGKFESIIYPVLMFDPPPFESPTDMDPMNLLQSSLWATLLGEKRDSYTFDELGSLIVPSSDLDVAAAKLFGPEVKLEHQTFGDFETMYAYDEETKTYYVPIGGQIGLYTPRVEKVVKKGDIFSLTVGYIPPGNAWTANLQGEKQEPEPDKYMIYELKKNKDSYQLMAIRDLEQVTLPGDVSGLDSPSSGQDTTSQEQSPEEESAAQ